MEFDGERERVEEYPPMLWLFEASGLPVEGRPVYFDTLSEWSASLEHKTQERVVKRLREMVQKTSRGQRAVVSAFLFVMDFVHIDQDARNGMPGQPSFLSDLNGTDPAHRETVIALLAYK